MQNKKRFTGAREQSLQLGKPATVKAAHEWLRWLVEMLVQEFSALSKDQAARFREGLLALTPSDSLVPAVREGDLSMRVLEALHRELREVIYGFVADPPRRWPLPSAFAFLQHSESGGVFYLSGEGSADIAVKWAVANLLMTAGESLLRCPECGTPFVRVRRQEYCSERCAQAVRDRRKADKRMKS